MPTSDSEHTERTFERLLDSTNPVDVLPLPITGASRAPRFFGYVAPAAGLTAAAQEAALNARSPWFHAIVRDDSVDRPGWARLVTIARPGDVVFVARPEVLGDATARIWERITELEAEGARVVLLKAEPPASTRPIGTVMVVGDVHGDLGWVKTVLERAHQLGVDTVLSVGDWGIGPWPGDRPGSRFGPKTERIAAKNGVTCYLVPGNHENYDTISALTARPDGWLELTEHVLVAPRGHRWSWGGGVQFGALGGAFSVDWRHRQAGRDWWPEVEELRPEDVERLGSGDLDILVSHDVPSGVPVGPGALVSTLPIPEADLARAQMSRDELLVAVRRTRPELVVCGHHHQRLSTALAAELAVRDVRPTVAERTLGYVDEARRGRIGVEVLDMQRTDRNWVLLDLADLAITEQATAIARARDRADR